MGADDWLRAIIACSGESVLKKDSGKASGEESISRIQSLLYDRILKQIDLTEMPDDIDLQEMIHEAVKASAHENHLSLHEQILLGRSLFNSFRKLDLLQELLEDPHVTEIMINGTDRIFIEKKGKLIRTDRRFISLEKLENIIQQIAAGSNRMVNEFSPIVDARLEDGSRVNIVLPPVSVDGPAVTVRRFPEQPIRMEELVAFGELTEEAADFLCTLVKAKYNLFISGGTGAGKTTFLGALSECIPEDERIITIDNKMCFYSL